MEQNAIVCEAFADGKRWEASLAVQLIVNPTLFKAVQDFGSGMKLDTDDFAWTPCRCIYEALQDYHEHHTEPPTAQLICWQAEEIADARKIGAKTPALMLEEKQAMYYILNTAVTAVPEPSEYMASETYKFVRMRRVQNNLAQYSSAIVRGVGVGELVDAMVQLKDTGVTTRQFGQNRASKIEHAITGSDEHRLGTGITLLDILMQGGVMTGELALVLGLTGLGKSNLLAQFAVRCVECGGHALLITLEMDSRETKDRIYCIGGHIRGSVINTPMEMWSGSDIQRLRLFAENEALGGAIAIEELNDSERTVAMIDRAIAGWLAHEEKTYGSRESARLVCIDYLDKLAEHMPRKSKTEGDHLVFERIADQLKELAKKYDVVIWSAVQGTTTASKSRVMKMEHVSGGLHKIKPASILIGLQLTQESLDAEASAMRDENVDLDMDRTMELTFIKNRKGIKRVIKVYQGYDLRVWDRVDHFQQQMELAKAQLESCTLFVRQASK